MIGRGDIPPAPSVRLPPLVFEATEASSNTVIVSTEAVIVSVPDHKQQSLLMQPVASTARQASPLAPVYPALQAQAVEELLPCGESAFSGHGVQAVALEWSVYVPVAQGAQAPPTGPALPSLQSEYCGAEHRRSERASEIEREIERERKKASES